MAIFRSIPRFNNSHTVFRINDFPQKIQICNPISQRGYLVQPIGYAEVSSPTSNLGRDSGNLGARDLGKEDFEYSSAIRVQRSNLWVASHHSYLKY